MTVETQSGGDPIVKSGPYNGDGVTTNLDYDFQVQANTEILVTRQNADLTEDVLVLTTDYTVTGVGNDAGGQIVLVDPATDFVTGSKIVITYDGNYNQSVDYSNQGAIQLSLLEASLDKIAMHLRTLKEQADRAVKVDSFGTVDIDTLTANISALAAIEAAISNVSSISAEIIAVDADATDIGTVASNIASINTIVLNLADVLTVAGIDADITTVAGDSADIATVAANIANINAAVADLPSLAAKVSKTGDAMTGTLSLAQGSDVASAAALTLGDGNIFDITGTTTITSIGTKGVGTMVTLQFDAALTLTHHATDLVLPDGANITTAAGYIATFYEYATGDWRLVADNRDFSYPAVDTQTFTSSGTWTKPTGDYRYAIVDCIGAGGGGGGGRRDNGGLNNAGGGGGGGGARTIAVLDFAALGATETVTIGAGGTGAAAQATNATNGNDGNSGGDTTFGDWIIAGGGVFGGGGTTAIGNSGPQGRVGNIFDFPALLSSGEEGFTSGGAGNDAEAGTNAPAKNMLSGGGGGGGGAEGGQFAGGAGGDSGIGASVQTGGAGGAAGGTAGTVGAAGYALYGGLGSGGGGGGGNSTGAGGTGGAGGAPGGGGGGGGSGDGGDGGAGGDGARGEVRVYCF